MSNDRFMTTEELQLRMDQLRGELRGDATRTAEAAKQLADWRYYVRQFPWVSAAAVAAAGFMLVPRRRERPIVDEAALEKMVAENRVVVIPQKHQETKRSMIGSVGALVAAAAGRAAMSYVSQRLTEMSRPVEKSDEARIRSPK